MQPGGLLTSRTTRKKQQKKWLLIYCICGNAPSAAIRNEYRQGGGARANSLLMDWMPRTWEREAGLTLRICGGSAGRMGCPMVRWGWPARGTLRGYRAMPFLLWCGREAEPGGCIQPAQLAGGGCGGTTLLPGSPRRVPPLSAASPSTPLSRLPDGRSSTEPDEIRHIHFILRHSWENTQEIKVVLT